MKIDMNIEDLVTGAGGGGLIGAILTWLGFKSRLDSIERSMEAYQSKNTCSVTHKAIDQRLDSIENKQDKILDILMDGNIHG